jgi:DUF971 family protein
MSISPAEIIADKKENILTVRWSDGHESRYPFGLVRAGCPCVMCRGGHDKMSQDPDPSVFDVVLPDSPSTHLVSARAVGAYAISFTWEDGHNEGIYAWDYLRALCPCEKCDHEREATTK